MATSTSLRPALLSPYELQWADASIISATPNGDKYVNVKGTPNILIKGSVRFHSTNEAGRLKLGLACSKTTAENIQTFSETHLKPALANALAIPEPDAIALGKRPSPKKQKLAPASTPAQSTKALELKFSYSVDKFDSSKAIINISPNRVTTILCADLEAQTAVKSDTVTQNAEVEATCWISISKCDNGSYYVNLMPRQIVYVESTKPEKAAKEEAAAAPTFAGMTLTI